ncbi:MAG: DUF5615 family PIN-like protein [Acidobacteriota bacterium]
MITQTSRSTISAPACSTPSRWYRPKISTSHRFRHEVSPGPRHLCNDGPLAFRLGHDVLRAADIGLAQADDEELLQAAQNQNRLFVTRDRDFGGLVFVNAMGSGVLYLRVLPSSQNAVHQQLKRVLNAYSEEELRTAFVVIEAGGHRFRRVPNQ